MANCPKARATPTNSNPRVGSKIIEMGVRHTLPIRTPSTTIMYEVINIRHQSLLEPFVDVL